MVLCSKPSLGCRSTLRRSTRQCLPKDHSLTIALFTLLQRGKAARNPFTGRAISAPVLRSTVVPIDWPPPKEVLEEARRIEAWEQLHGRKYISASKNG